MFATREWTLFAVLEMFAYDSQVLKYKRFWKTMVILHCTRTISQMRNPTITLILDHSPYLLSQAQFPEISFIQDTGVKNYIYIFIFMQEKPGIFEICFQKYLLIYHHVLH